MIRDDGAAKETRREEGVKRFAAYYQGVLDEVDAVVAKMKEPLPCTFRIVSGIWEQAIEQKINECALIKKAGWHHLVYEIPLGRKELSARGVKENAGGVNQRELEKAHRFLKTHFAGSYLTRQETVSMIPVLALEVERGSVVLDMCASPGSKSSQILEQLGPEGMIICNDVNRRRIDQLVTQTKRFGHPGLVVTCHDSTAYPKTGICADRVLCDVPCSGDGTLRKNGHIFQKWSPREALALHRTQKKILARGLELLPAGGVLVYSTCSLNPVENELVVLSALAARTDVAIIPFEISGLVLREGLSEAALNHCLEKIDPGRSQEWPRYSDAIRHARRVHPQDQNTGGFFVVKLRKTGTSKPAKQRAGPAMAEQRGMIRGEAGIEESYFYYAEETVRERVEQEWGPSGLALVSKADSCRTIYGVSAPALRLLQTAPNSLRIVFAGVRLFSLFGKDQTEARAKDRWRVTYEGLSTFVPRKERLVALPLARCCQVLATGTDEELQQAAVKGMLVLRPTIGEQLLPVQVPVLVSAQGVNVLVDQVHQAALLELLRTVGESGVKSEQLASG